MTMCVCIHIISNLYSFNVTVVSRNARSCVLVSIFSTCDLDKMNKSDVDIYV